MDGRTNQKIKQIAKIDENDNCEVFEDTKKENLKIQQYDGSALKLIKSKLPHKSSLKMAAGSLKKKPFRLIMTVLLSMFAFFLFGLVNTMSSYDKTKVGTDSIIDSKVDYLSFVKEKNVVTSYYSYYSQTSLSEEDLKNLKEKFPNSIFNPVLSANDSDGSVTFDSNLFDATKLMVNEDYMYYSTSFPGISTITEDQIKELGYSLTGKLPKEENEIVITKYAAESFIAAGYLAPKSEKEVKISSSDDLVGKQLSLALDQAKEKNYVITGILDTKYDEERYDIFRKEITPEDSSIKNYLLAGEQSTVNTYSYHTLLYTTDQVWKDVLNSKFGVSPYDVDYNVYLYSQDYGYSLNKVMEFSELTDEMKKNLVLFDEKKDSLKENEVILSLSSLSENMELYPSLVSSNEQGDIEKAIRNNKEKIQKLGLTLEVSKAKDDWNSDSEEIKVVGIYLDDITRAEGLGIFYDGFYSKHNIDCTGIYQSILTKMPESRAEIEDVVKYSYDNGIKNVNYSIRNSTSNVLSMVNDFVDSVKNVLLFMGIVFAIFAGVMLMNFITTSISYRKREIGILRAVGARGRDVFVIFFQESLIIAFINWILATGLTGVVVFIINYVIRNDYGFMVTIFHFGAIQIIVMLAISLFVAFVASFIPVYNVSKKKPIEIIRKN